MQQQKPDREKQDSFFYRIFTMNLLCSSYLLCYNKNMRHNFAVYITLWRVIISCILRVDCRSFAFVIVVACRCNSLSSVVGIKQVNNKRKKKTERKEQSNLNYSLRALCIWLPEKLRPETWSDVVASCRSCYYCYFHSFSEYE